MSSRPSQRARGGPGFSAHRGTLKRPLHRAARVGSCSTLLDARARWGSLESPRSTPGRGRAQPGQRVGRGRRLARPRRPPRTGSEGASARDTTSGCSRGRSAHPHPAQPPRDRAPVRRALAVGPARCGGRCSRRRASDIASRRPPRDRHGAPRREPCTEPLASSDTMPRTEAVHASSCSPCTPYHPRAPALGSTDSNGVPRTRVEVSRFVQPTSSPRAWGASRKSQNCRAA